MSKRRAREQEGGRPLAIPPWKPGMRKRDEYLCSDLVSIRPSTGETVIAHLEKISTSGCHITLEERVAAASVVELQCVECPKGDAHCSQCRITGVVTSQHDDSPLGILAAVEFTNGIWCKERWKPRHLTDPASLELNSPKRAMERRYACAILSKSSLFKTL